MASLLCGLASSMGMLVVARALQGFVAGPMYPVAQALMISIYPPAKRGQAIALLAIGKVVAPTAGPVPGGRDTDKRSAAQRGGQEGVLMGCNRGSQYIQKK